MNRPGSSAIKNKQLGNNLGIGFTPKKVFYKLFIK